MRIDAHQRSQPNFSLFSDKTQGTHNCSLRFIRHTVEDLQNYK